MHGYATPQQPQYWSVTPTQRPQTSSEVLRSNYYANIQASGGQGAGQVMPPPGQMVSPGYGDTRAASMQLAMNTSFDSSQMQTPPPTRGASGRKAQHTPQVAFGTPSTIASRRFMTPQQQYFPVSSGAMQQQSAMQFPQLQFSPDLYQYANVGPASAPVAAQSRIFWNHTESPIQGVPQGSLDDPFAPAVTTPMGWPAPQPAPATAATPGFNTPAMNSFLVQQPHPRPATALASSAGFAVAEIRDGSSAGVDPSLVYSSPIRPVVRSTSRNTKTKTRQQPAVVHNPSNESTASTHNRTNTASSTDTIATNSTSSLQRSNTIGTTRPKSGNFPMNAKDSLQRSSTTNQITRTASPVKRFGRPPLDSISEGKPRQRTSVILTVDENGRARTETKRVEESPTRSIRERYPALFDSDSSDDESDGSDQTPSRPSSFIFDKRDERRSKAARLDPPVENLEGLSIPRSSSAASMKKGVTPSRAAVAATAQLRRQGSLRRSSSNRSQNRKSFMSKSTNSLIDTAPMEVSTPQQPATVAVSQVEPDIDWSGDTFRGASFNPESTLDAHNRRWSMMSEQQHVPILSPQHQQYQSSLFQPHTRPPQARPLLIRCVCGIPDDQGQPLIQCQSCTQWLHSPCLGLDAQAPPPNFTCFLCTKPAPFRAAVPPR